METMLLGTVKEVLDFLPLPFNFIILILVIVFGSMVVIAIIEEIGKYVRHRNRSELKRDLLDRGLGAEEIHLIVEAGKEEPEED